MRECKKQFKAAVFNVVTHNRDDHAKNFSFLMDTKGVWQVSPAYDLTFSSGVASEHWTIMMGEGKNPTLDHLLKLAGVGGIKRHAATIIIDEIKFAVSKWPDFAHEAGVTKNSTSMIQTAIDLLPGIYLFNRLTLITAHLPSFLLQHDRDLIANRIR